ncbi:Pls/PosA family non-ribosomal peptide synthetase [Methylosinus sp. Sm6]|uniref:Pls/PosA family non-ribosomal peptide synthetase n=1 Tax=Methylosinus sp. Sm6 TaxID=2866948 RepID=UPI00351CCB92
MNELSPHFRHASPLLAAGAPSGYVPRGAVLRGADMPHLLRDETLSEIFAARVAASPHALAMSTLERRFTYREVDAQANAIAHGLVARGIGPGQVVGLWMSRGPELLIAQIAIAKTGAAWLPFDADAPVERIAVCLSDADARGLLTSVHFAVKAAGVGVEIWVDAEIASLRDAPLPDPRLAGASADDAAYLIYTSGSTGTPKGIVVTQRNICHYLRSANEIYGITSSDVVFQGASVAFDLSMEEIWIPYLAGASLFVATPQIIGETEALPDILEEAGVTVLDTVPTLLAALPRDVATLRKIVLGGEACPPSVAERWTRIGRTIFNSYGPTEATVVATVSEVWPNEKVTIGKPIPNYSCYVVDENLELLPPGAEGELLIGGPGVARGYLRRDELTAEKFIANPFCDDGSDPILYRSGDAVALDETGNLAFRGRIDDQVKIRGFRVELGEIESVLSTLPHIRQAAVVLRNEDGLDELVAFLVGATAVIPDPRELRAKLREFLPSYMVPARFEVVASLPTLSSGKVDRKALKRAPLSAPLLDAEAQEEPRSDTEAKLLDAARRVLPPGAIPFDADFFTDLGGHSLLAARFVSVVRETERLASITLQDLYAQRTLRALAAHLDGKAAASPAPRDLSFAPPPLLKRFLCGLAQAAALPFILAFVTSQWLGVFVSYMLLTSPDASIVEEAVALLGVYMCVNIATVAVSILGKWLVIGRTRPGRYPLWGVYYYRWWLAQRLIGLTHAKWFQASPLMRLYLRALGARIGEDAIIGELDVGAIDLVSIGDGASLGGKLKLANARVVGNELIIGPIDIGADAYVGTSCVIEENVVLEEGAALEDLSSVPSGARIGAREIWNGSPARHEGRVNAEALDSPSAASALRRVVMSALFAMVALALPPLGLLPIFPAFWVFDKLDAWLGLVDGEHAYYLAAIPLFAWPTAFVLVLVTVAFIVAFRWTVLPRVSEGTYSVWSWFYLRKWAVGLATEVTLETLSSLFATLYMRSWYRLMGAKIGKDSEISTNLSGRYDLVEIGEKCFIADEVVLGDEDMRRGWMYLRKVKTGSRVFIGNDAVVPPGSEIPNGALIGIKSKPPANSELSEGDTWFGSPPIRLPVRQTFDGGGAAWTYQPPFWKKAARAAYEAINVSLPTMLFITFGTWAVESFAQKLIDGEYGAAFWLFVLCSTLISLGMTLVVVAVKWLTMGRYEPQVKPMWSFWAMRTEACAVLYWGLAGKILLEHLRGTPFLPWVLRLFGAKFGKGVFADMTDITEFDCVSVGDYAALNQVAALQTHLYEDRVMKVGRVMIGRGVTVGAGSTVLYDTHVGDFARLGPLTVVMKGETIPPHSEWVGAPAEPARSAPAPAVRQAKAA